MMSGARVWPGGGKKRKGLGERVAYVFEERERRGLLRNRIDGRLRGDLGLAEKGRGRVEADRGPSEKKKALAIAAQSARQLGRKKKSRDERGFCRKKKKTIALKGESLQG